jgi:hypothetical protein
VFCSLLLLPQSYAARRVLERPEALRLEDGFCAEAVFFRPILREGCEAAFPELRPSLRLLALVRLLPEERPAP